ncbi:conjugal transfer mating-pair stabilization protein TraG [Kosakonia sp. MH5]|uniref:conjugal transfer mating-pair stabilization protein TraG n=1 Tax=Kosakonia sp. MH5 TaxID=2202822 RepID=UPI001374BEEC|nr:conjugal transfer mating-pair stabilization protein TraG [Kosakonia sp. MH5]NCF08768.1 conjugal transfer protein TraG [Kosakonia sp. MH5]
MLEVYTIYGGGMWKSAFDAVVGILGTSTWGTLLRIVGTFSVLGIVASFVKSRNPMVFVQWLAVFTLITSALIVPKRSVQIIDITDPATVWVTDNVPVGLAGIASLSTSIGFHVAQLYDYMMARPDSVTYTKTGMLFGSGIVAESSDMQTQNPELAQMLPDYVENCVIGDILLNHKYTVNQLLNTTDPLGLITSNPSPLRGIFKTTSDTREFLTCQQAAAQIQTLAGQDAQVSSPTFAWLTQKIFGNRLNGATLLANSMGESYGFFYAGGMSAAQIMKNNVTNSAIQQGIRGFAARSSDTANLLNLATENAATKQRISWAAGSTLATRQLPFLQSLMMLILVCLFPLVIALAAANHSIFGLNTLKIYICGFLYFQMWPVMFAILNYAATFWLQTKTGGTPLVLSNKDAVALQHSDVANLAGYCAMSIPVLSFFLTKGAAAIGSQVAGSVMSSMAFGSAGVASTTADGNWSFNNMSMDNVNQNKMDTNLMQRQGQQTWQADNGSSHTVTASGQNVIDGSGAMSNLPVNMRLSQLASSGFQEQARLSQVQAQSSLDGYNHSVTSGWSQLQQLSSQTGSTDSLSKGTDNSQTLNASRGASMMMSAAESYAKANNISTQQAYNDLMSKSQEGSFNAGGKLYGKLDTGDAAWGKIGKWAVGASGGVEAHMGVDYKGTDGSSHGTQNSSANSLDTRHDKNTQAVHDFKQGMDMVTSSRVSDSASHSDSAGTSKVQQFAATLNDAQSQYHQFTTSSTNSDEFSRMATLAQNESASLDTNYTQEFVDWASNKYGDKAQAMLTSAPTAREAAMEFVNERLKPEIMGDYQQGRTDLTSGNEHAAFSGNHIVQSSDMTSEAVSQTTSVSSGNSANGRHTVNNETAAPASHSLGETAGNHLRGNRVPGDDMQNDFRENQNRLKGQSFSEQSDVPRKVAEERSANEQNINKSAGEIEQNRSTVQTSSDILKGEHSNAQSTFAAGYETEKAKQNLLPQSAEEKDIQTRLEEMRKRAG